MCSDLTKTYRSDAVLDQVSLTLEKNKIGHQITYLSVAVIILVLIIPGVNNLLHLLIEGFWQDNALWCFSGLILVALVFFGVATLVMRKAPLQSANGK